MLTDVGNRAGQFPPCEHLGRPRKMMEVEISAECLMHSG